MENNWYNTNEPFNLEVEITDDSMCKTIEDMILRSVMKGTELLPGLKVNKAYKQSLDKQDVLSCEMEDDFNELMQLTGKAFKKFFNKWNNYKHQELNDVNEHETNVSSDGSFNGWAPVTNCIRNCKRCFVKCLYRKEENIEQNKKRKIITKSEDIKHAEKIYDGGWVDMEDHNAMEKMFNTFTI